MPATKSALRGSTRAVPATKSALRGSQSAAPATKSALRVSPSAAPATKSALRGSPSAAPATHFEVHQALRLPRNLRFQAASAAPATKSALRGFTKSCACHEICTSRFTKRCTCHEICASRLTKCHEICTSRFTERCTCHEISTSRFSKRACHEICTSRLTLRLCLARNLQTSQMSTSHDSLHLSSHDSLHLSRNLSSSTITTKCPKCPATKTAFRSTTAPIPCTLSPKFDFGAPTREVSLAPATKSHHHVRKCAYDRRDGVRCECEKVHARHHNESAVVRSTRRRHPDSASLRSRNAHG